MIGTGKNSKLYPQRKQKLSLTYLYAHSDTTSYDVKPKIKNNLWILEVEDNKRYSSLKLYYLKNQRSLVFYFFLEKSKKLLQGLRNFRTTVEIYFLFSQTNSVADDVKATIENVLLIVCEKISCEVQTLLSLFLFFTQI